MRRTRSAHYKPPFKNKKAYGFILGLVAFLAIVFLVNQVKSSVFFDPHRRTTIAFHTTPTVIVSFPKEETDRIVIVTIPGNVYVNVPYGYGQYRMEAIWRLGELEKKAELFKESVSDLLAVTVNAWVGVSRAEELPDSDSVELVSTLKKEYGTTSLISNRIISSLNLVDRLLLTYKLTTMKSIDMTVFETHKNTRLFVDSQLVDGTRVKVINESALDQFLEQKFEESLVRQENLSLEIRNTTGSANIGQKFARYVTNMGGKVIQVTNDRRSVEVCTILVGEENQNKKLIQLLIDEFSCSVEVTEDKGADVVILVGVAFAKRWQDTNSQVLE